MLPSGFSVKRRLTPIYKLPIFDNNTQVRALRRHQLTGLLFFLHDKNNINGKVTVLMNKGNAFLGDSRRQRNRLRHFRNFSGSRSVSSFLSKVVVL